MKKIYVSLPQFLKNAVYCGFAGILVCFPFTTSIGQDSQEKTLKSVQQLFQDGNYKESYDAAYKILKQMPDDSRDASVGELWRFAVNSLLNNNRIAEYDDFYSFATKKFRNNLYLLCELAPVQSWGFMIDGKFQRGSNRGNTGRRVSSDMRDKIDIYRLMVAALPEVEKTDKELAIKFYLRLASVIMHDSYGEESWRLQSLVDLTKLPDYDETPVYSSSRPPVMPDGSPVYYRTPSSFSTAKNEGERMRWTLEQAIKLGSVEAKKQFADFLANQFDFTQINYSIRHEYFTSDIYRDFLYELKENETVAELADGVRKITLPEEFNYFRLYEECKAYRELASLYLGRLQYEKAAEYFKKVNDTRRVQEIIGNYGFSDPINVQTKGKQPVLTYHFRNAQSVNATVFRVNAQKAVEIMLSSLEKPRNGVYMNLIAYELNRGTIQDGNQNQWLPAIEKEVTKFKLNLTPKPHHWETEQEITLPITEAGAYLVRLAPDNSAFNSFTEILVWITPEILNTVTLPQKTILTLNDSETGAPLKQHDIKVINYETKYANTPQQQQEFGGRVKIIKTEQVFKTDEQGVADIGKIRQRGTNLILSLSEDRLTFLPNAYFYYNENYNIGNEQRIYIITDRPAYRPGDTVKFTVYGRTPSYKEPYDIKNKLPNPLEIRANDSRGAKVYEAKLTVDAELNGAKGEFVLPEDVSLGQMDLFLKNGGGAVGFTVEEYKKPEYLLSVNMPENQIKTGNFFEAEIQAKYYFGAPMANAKVKYKVFRERSERNYPFWGRFDWLYGRGYWVCSTYLHECFFERQGFFGRDLVTTAEGTTDEKGILKVPVDTSSALAKFGDHDYRYSIEAEVSDESNRVVSSNGSIITAKQPFYVEMSSRNGFIKTGKQFMLQVKAVTPDGKEIQGNGSLKIYRKKLGANGVPERYGNPVKTVDITAGDENGVHFVMEQPGVYEIVADITSELSFGSQKDKEKVTCTGIYPLYVSGIQKSDELFGELPIELIMDKSEYKPGDEAEILVMTKYPGYSLYIFRNCERDSKWEYCDMKSSSESFKIKINTDDRPNTYVKVMAVGHGEVLNISKMLPVPPTSKILNISISGIDDKVKPGDKLPLKLHVTDLDGKPVTGAVTLTVYDKSLEAIAHSRIPAINSFFWNWKRYFYDNHSSNLNHFTSQIIIESCTFPLYESSYFYRNPFIWNMNRLSGIQEMARRGNGRMLMKSSSAMEADDFAVQTNDFVARGAMPMMAAEEAAPTSVMARKEKASDMGVKMEAAIDEDAGMTDGVAKENNTIVRSNFLDTAFFAGLIQLDEKGETTFEIPVPDNMTTWKVHAWVLNKEASVGEASTEFVVSKDLLARLELPRFLVRSDSVKAVANVHNNSDKSMTATVTLSCKNNTVSLKDTTKTIEVPAYGHTPCYFTISANEVGNADFTLSVVAGKESDALTLSIPVLVRGIDKQVNGFARLDKNMTSAKIPIVIPEERKKETTFLSVKLAPGVAKSVLELLPYLAADGTPNVFGVANRFVPTLSTKYALSKLGIDFKTLQLQPTNRDKLYREYMEHYCWNGTPVPSFTAEQFTKVNADSLKMLLGMVNSDGGWGWFSGYGEVSGPDTTAYVLDALLDAKEFGEKSLDTHIKNAVSWLNTYANKRLSDWKAHPESGVSNTDAFVARVLTKANAVNQSFLNRIYEKRTDGLAPYGLSMLALALSEKSDERAMVIRNLTQFLKIDTENQTAYLNIPAGCLWFWYGDENETNAAYLELQLAQDPTSALTHQLANYLVTNVRNSPWRNSTRAVGAVVRALSRYMILTQETKCDLVAKVFYDGKEVKQFKIGDDNYWNEEFVYSASSENLTTGNHEIMVSIEGNGVMYVNTAINYFTMEEEITEAGLEMKVKRNYYRLVSDVKDDIAAGVNGSVQDVKRDQYKRVLLKSGDFIRAGELVEVELITTAKNDYDYVCVADSMPAGFEFVEPISGYTWRWGNAPIFREFRERGAKFYMRNMARGQSNIFYSIRAQLDGTFIALPAQGSGVYAPELKCNSAQFKFNIQ